MWHILGKNPHLRPDKRPNAYNKKPGVNFHHSRLIIRRLPKTVGVFMFRCSYHSSLYCTPSADAKKIKDLQNAGVEVLSIEAKDGHVNLKKLTEELGRMQIDSIFTGGRSSFGSSSL